MGQTGAAWVPYPLPGAAGRSANEAGAPSGAAKRTPEVTPRACASRFAGAGLVRGFGVHVNPILGRSQMTVEELAEGLQ